MPFHPQTVIFNSGLNLVEYFLLIHIVSFRKMFHRKRFEALNASEAVVVQLH